MKVVCIRDTWYPSAKVNPAVIHITPYVGEECEVTGHHRENNRDFYFLAGRFPKNVAFYVDNFAPVSDIDETTFERNYDKATV